ncbi:hypothetical protein ASG35_21650 [Burkholderia sp. Leaf177]|uniref:hypothetical protein n=1 Tax=Burkholderia sp. Leaf177 TaxID=1736287 RepID=UPI0006F31C74|nr:hypothetical protein [Burkholderia sp. Leaf177]KQR73596.1 hypothetical protein ASG35_21650 [Burkholderia sp. Leaf177]
MRYRRLYALFLLLSRRLRLVLAFGFLFAVSQAHAGWTIAAADAPATVIRATNVYQLGAGEALRDDDLIESAPRSVVQLQDDAGRLLALGAQTRVLLQAGTRVSLLDGWLKVAQTCATQPCAATVIDTERGALELGANSAAVIAALPGAEGSKSTVAVFSESGTQTLAASAHRNAVAPGSFAYAIANTPPQIAQRPSSAFLADMPVAFRDALQRVPVTPAAHDHAIKPLRAASYDDVSAWLTSDLPARKRFPARFRPRLSDPAFRRAIDQNLKALPEWRVLLYPPAPHPDARQRALQSLRVNTSALPANSLYQHP